MEKLKIRIYFNWNGKPLFSCKQLNNAYQYPLPLMDINQLQLELKINELV